MNMPDGLDGQNRAKRSLKTLAVVASVVLLPFVSTAPALADDCGQMLAPYFALAKGGSQGAAVFATITRQVGHIFSPTDLTTGASVASVEYSSSIGVTKVYLDYGDKVQWPGNPLSDYREALYSILWTRVNSSSNATMDMFAPSSNNPTLAFAIDTRGNINVQRRLHNNPIPGSSGTHQGICSSGLIYAVDNGTGWMITLTTGLWKPSIP